MTEVLIPVGKERSTGKIVYIDEVTSGIGCNCICIACEQPLVASKGNVNQHHFKHAAKLVSEDKLCTFNMARAFYWLLKKVIESGKSLLIPPLMYKKQVVAQEVRINTMVTKGEFTEIDGQGVYTFSVKGNQYQIWFSDKAILPNSDDFNILKLDVSKLVMTLTAEKQSFRETLEQCLSNNFLQWVSHPELKKLKQPRVEDVVDEIVASYRGGRKEMTDVYEAPDKPALDMYDSQMPIMKSNNIGSQKTKSYDKNVCEMRLTELVGSTIALLNNEIKSIKQCDTCCFSYPLSQSSCHKCGSVAHKIIQASLLSIGNIRSRYWQANLAEKSLGAIG